jgi:flagellar protein FliS
MNYEMTTTYPTRESRSATPVRAMSGYGGQVARYRDTDLASASPGRLVVMLYDQILLSLRRARVALDAGQIETRAVQIIRASDMITELRMSLDHEQGGAIATNLDSLYAYMLAELLDANRRQDAVPLDRVLVIAAELRDAFGQVVASAAATAVPAARSA